MPVYYAGLAELGFDRGAGGREQVEGVLYGFNVGKVLPEEGFAAGAGAARGCVEAKGAAQHGLYRGVFVRSRHILYNVPDSAGLGVVEMLDEACDLGEGFAAGVCDSLVFSRIRVWLAGWACYYDVDAFGEGLEGG